MQPVSGGQPVDPSHSIVRPPIDNQQADDQQAIIEFSALFRHQVNKSQEQRFIKVEKLTSEQKESLKTLERDLEKIMDLATELRSIRSNPDAQIDDTNISQIVGKISRLSSEIYENYIPFMLQPKTILPGLTEIELALFSESALNAFVNRYCYMNEIENTFNTELQEILDFFNLPLSRVSKVFIPDTETHNQGKSVAYITLESENLEKIKLVYKPREAKIDDAVINAFREINSLPLSEKSASFDLPTYKIYHNQNGLGSIWEFISDKSLRKSLIKNPQPLGIYVSGQQENLKIKAVRMDEVLSLLHVTDQHGENILLKKNANRELDFFPVDLEVILFPENDDQPIHTGLQTSRIKEELISKSKFFELTDAEKEIIRKTRENFSDYTVRLVPMRTYGLVQKLTNISNYSLIAEIFMNSIIEDNYSPAENVLLTLQENIILDYLNNDVPYLSVKNGTLYYGKVENNIILGSKRE